MESVIAIASYLSGRYQQERGAKMEEMKLHRLLYFTQRESIIQTGAPMFDAEFRARRTGPIVLSVREAYRADKLQEQISQETKDKYKEVFDFIFKEFAPSKTTTLQYLSQSEYSWKHARAGYGEYEQSDVPMDIKDFYVDADKAKEWRAELPIRQKVQYFLMQHRPQLKNVYLL